MFIVLVFIYRHKLLVASTVIRSGISRERPDSTHRTVVVIISLMGTTPPGCDEIAASRLDWSDPEGMQQSCTRNDVMSLLGDIVLTAC